MSKWPVDLKAHASQKIELEGRAANAKMGALLLPPDSDSPVLWLKGLDSWPSDFQQEEPVKVTGTLETRTTVNPETRREFPDEDGTVRVEYRAGTAPGVETRLVLVDFSWKKME
jgi:hypothetical protein